ncbi:MAG: hypothetical protein HY731_00305 [Candidatus Tectomicrobia bacterium]|nr:hypothetical protein [Candidatus Tectomicrobia bacterium]
MSTLLWMVIPSLALLLISIILETLLPPDTGVIIRRLFGYLAMGVLLFPLVHSLRKHLPIMSTWGRLHTWLNFHEAMGIAGATAVVIHSGYSTGGALTYVALSLALMTVLSGLVGTVIYHRILKLYHAN